tara:strand:+ start:17785 stop:18783 length:999 start_codon:yes stop_codon:yes gene_type:complete
MIADIVVDLQYGDCGKGKVTHHLLRTSKYTHCIRYNGGCNAGHTIFHEGKKFVTHHIPAGVFFGVRSIIGSGCVVNLEQFFSEIDELEAAGIDCKNLIKIAKNTHIITNEHVEEDQKEFSIGTTKRGNGPAYRDKYARKGIRAEELEVLEPYVVDLYTELHSPYPTCVLLEGAQGFGLDIDWGDYPYVTSSHCTAAGALLNGIPPFSVRKIYGVAKAYETYVGAKNFEPKEEIFQKLRDAGDEYGATTGRPRQCNWTNIDLLEKAAKINGITDLVINKVDVMREVNSWCFRFGDSITTRFQGENEWKNFLKSYMKKKMGNVKIYFSESPEEI